MQAVERRGYYLDRGGRVNHRDVRSLLSSELVSLAQLNWRQTYADFLSLSSNIRKEVARRGLGNHLLVLLKRERQAPNN